jgi:hypothetical protein
MKAAVEITGGTAEDNTPQAAGRRTVLARVHGPKSLDALARPAGGGVFDKPDTPPQNIFTSIGLPLI